MMKTHEIIKDLIVFFYRISKRGIYLTKQLILLLLFFILFAYPTLHLLLALTPNLKLADLDITIVVPFAATLSFGSLMYGRVRAIDSKLLKFRSLYIAERLLSASGYYLVCILLILLCLELSSQYNFKLDMNSTLGENPYALILLCPFYFFIGYCAELYFALLAMNFNISGRRPKYVAPKIKKMLKN